MHDDDAARAVAVRVRVLFSRPAVRGPARVAEAIVAVEQELGQDGRVLLRPSGTEQLVRVMVEAPTQEQADAVAARLADVVAAVS